MTHYSGKLPERKLTAAEEKLLSQRVMQGDQEAFNIMVECNMRLVLSIVRRWAIPAGIDSDDLVQEGMLALIKAVRGYDWRKARFTTYAYTSIKRQILSWIQREFRRFEKQKSLPPTSYRDQLPGNDYGNEDHPLAPEPATDYDFTDYGAMARAMPSLDCRERHVLKMRYGLDNEPTCTLEEAGEALGISRERIRQLQKRSVMKLRDLMGVA